jgi:hypothetical protein
MMGRSRRPADLAQANPCQDHQAICHWLAGWEFPWDITRALELALLKTFCIPSIAGLLDRTGELTHRPRKRYDDTGLMVAELLKHGYDSPEGQAVIERMNRIHGHYAIGNDDYCYVLSTFVCEPIRWLNRFGWRSLLSDEQEALFYFWAKVGERMGIQAIPGSLEDLLAFNLSFEAEHCRYAQANQRVAEATLQMLLEELPPLLHPWLRPTLISLNDRATQSALGWEAPPQGLTAIVHGLVRCRSWLAGHLPPRRRSQFYSDHHPPSYPQGYQLRDLGPPSLLKRLNQQRPD